MKGQEVICISDDYTEDVLMRWAEHGVKHPVKGKIYTVRDIIKHSSHQGRNMIGVRLNELNNPLVPVDRPFPMDIEPTFSILRFTTLLGESLVLEEETLNTVDHEQKY